MLQIVISLFLIVSISNSENNGLRTPSDTTGAHQTQIKATENALDKTAEAKKLLTEVNRRVPNWCSIELGNIELTERNLLQAAQKRAATPQFVTSQNNTTEEQLLLCSRNISGKIMNIKHPISQESWYYQYLADKKYLKDFERYPELERQFNKKMNPAHQQFKNYSAQSDIYEPTATIFLHMRSHPYFQDPNLPKAYNDELVRLKREWDAKVCDPKDEQIKRCAEHLKKTVG